MPTNKKGLLIAGLAAFAYYKYSKMSPEQKTNLMSTIKEKGKQLLGGSLPKDLFAGKQDMTPEYGKGTF